MPRQAFTVVKATNPMVFGILPVPCPFQMGNFLFSKAQVASQQPLWLIPSGSRSLPDLWPKPAPCTPEPRAYRPRSFQPISSTQLGAPCSPASNAGASRARLSHGHSPWEILSLVRTQISTAIMGHQKYSLVDGPKTSKLDICH